MVLFFFIMIIIFCPANQELGLRVIDYAFEWDACLDQSQQITVTMARRRRRSQRRKMKKIKKSPPCFLLTTPPFDLGRPYVFLLPQNGPDTRSFPRLLRVSLPAFQPGIRIRLLFLLLLLLPPETLAQILHFFFSSRIFASCLLYYLSYPTFENRKNRLLVRN